MTQSIDKIVLDGAAYAVGSLLQTARDTLVILQFVDVGLAQLRDEMAVSRTAHVAYARALKAELDQMASPMLSVPPSP